LLYVLPALVVWGGFVSAGIHPSIAGVILGLMTPARPWFGQRGFLHEAGLALREISSRDDGSIDYRELMLPLQRLKGAGREAVPPVVRLEATLHPWVAYGIMPLFALANAGVTLDEMRWELPGATPTMIGITLGLVLGKPLGIVGASLLGTKLGICSLPRDVRLPGLVVVGLVGGIGFTMALFIANLAFSDPLRLGIAKAAVLAGSLISGVVAYVVGRALLREPSHAVSHVTESEAEGSTEL
jgi:NhaA family Na+:H+ antiporter